MKIDSAIFCERNFRTSNLRCTDLQVLLYAQRCVRTLAAPRQWSESTLVVRIVRTSRMLDACRPSITTSSCIIIIILIIKIIMIIGSEISIIIIKISFITFYINGVNKGVNVFSILLVNSTSPNFILLNLFFKIFFEFIISFKIFLYDKGRLTEF